MAPNRFETTRRMARTAVALLALTAVAPPSAPAHTPQDEAACRPDVFRLCASAIPDERRIVACLERNKRKLSSACYRVFDRGTPAASPARSDAQPALWGR